MTINYQPPIPTLNNSKLESLLNQHLGKTITVYMNFENSQWGSKIFKGELRYFDLDFILISDYHSHLTHLLPINYLSYLTFDDQLEIKI